MVVTREVRFMTVPELVEGACAIRKVGVEVRLCLFADRAASGMEPESSLALLFLPMIGVSREKLTSTNTNTKSRLPSLRLGQIWN